jgi:hypothetical protein
MSHADEVYVNTSSNVMKRTELHDRNGKSAGKYSAATCKGYGDDGAGNMELTLFKSTKP